MKDREHLIWIHERLVHVHSESPLHDYMHKLRAIIAATPAEQETPTVGGRCHGVAHRRRRDG